MANNPQALAAWRATPEIKSALASLRSYRLTEAADGSFTAESVPAGDYVLNVSVSEAPTNGGQWNLRAQAHIPVTVPAEPASGTLDLGELPLEALK